MQSNGRVALSLAPLNDSRQCFPSTHVAKLELLQFELHTHQSHQVHQSGHVTFIDVTKTTMPEATSNLPHSTLVKLALGHWMAKWWVKVSSQLFGHNLYIIHLQRRNLVVEEHFHSGFGKLLHEHDIISQSRNIQILSSHQNAAVAQSTDETCFIGY